ncbi:DUF2267 domain-containing protein [Rhodoblastus sp.]|uniref:DUF2267 domain-containing protein n=1 Tax=Rhodoblastus sp. TaxID=1962975 RepID=UPI0035B4305B
MPMPLDYQHASEDFERFLRDVIGRTGLTTRNQAFTTVQGVLLAFRRRLDLRDAIRFAGCLPPVLRAIFVADWETDAPKPEFGAREQWIREVKALRGDHNFSPDCAIADVAAALRAQIGDAAPDQALATAPPAARAFWRIGD